MAYNLPALFVFWLALWRLVLAHIHRFQGGLRPSHLGSMGHSLNLKFGSRRNSNETSFLQKWNS